LVAEKCIDLHRRTTEIVFVRQGHSDSGVTLGQESDEAQTRADQKRITEHEKRQNLPFGAELPLRPRLPRIGSIEHVGGAIRASDKHVLSKSALERSTRAWFWRRVREEGAAT
jgi:hypothetical protein